MLLNSGFQACTITPGSLISDVTFFTTFTKRSVLEDTGNAELNKHSLWNCSRSAGSHPQHGTETCRAKREGAGPLGLGLTSSPAPPPLAPAGSGDPEVGLRALGEASDGGFRGWPAPRGPTRVPAVRRPRDRKETEAATVTCQPKMEPRRAELRLC